MKVSINWLKELIDLKVSVEELISLLPLRTIGLKEVTSDYFELDMKGYNRADLLSIRGVAKEVSAITDSEVKFTEEKLENHNLPAVSVEIENEDLTPVYCLAKIENLKVEHSSDTWVKKLNDSGIRSINNVADITNLAMLEFGQPMHAFDAEKTKGVVGVRHAKTGEEITTLDGKVRELGESDLLITDDAGPIGLAGVMGGKDSEISDSTTSILLEAAIFDPKTLRKTSQKLALHSEASKRFQHGLTKTNLQQALASAIKMYESLGGKVTAIALTGDLEDKPKTIKLSQDKIYSLIGIEIKPEEIESSLKKLGFKLASHLTSGNVDIEVPYWRLDVNIEEDVIEEIARMYGYERIPAKPLSGNIPTAVQNPIFGLIEKLKQALVGKGLTEVQTYSYYSTTVTVNCNLKTETLIKIANPISAETEYLRDNLWPNLLEVTAKNIRQGFKDIAIFELGKVYSTRNNLPKEEYHLAIALCNGTDNPLAELNQIAKSLNLEGGELTGEYFHPTRHTDGMTEIHKRISDKFGINQRVAVLEMEIKATP